VWGEFVNYSKVLGFAGGPSDRTRKHKFIIKYLRGRGEGRKTMSLDSYALYEMSRTDFFFAGYLAVSLCGNLVGK